MIDRKSTRLNSSHLVISYAVFCLKKKTRTSRRRTRIWHEGADTSPSPHTSRSANYEPQFVAYRQTCRSFGYVSGFFFFFFNEAAPTDFSLFPHPAPLPI